MSLESALMRVAALQAWAAPPAPPAVQQPAPTGPTLPTTLAPASCRCRATPVHVELPR